MEDVLLDFTEDARKAIAHKAIARKTGACGLRSIMESILLDPMFDLPGLENVEEIVINREVVDGRAKPLYIYTDRREDLGTSAQASVMVGSFVWALKSEIGSASCRAKGCKEV